MHIKHGFLISIFFASFSGNSQNFGGIYKIGELFKRIDHPDTVYVVNFWATWCKPCVEELPTFDSLLITTSKLPVKILLVSLDFREDLTKKVKPFLDKHRVKPECILLDEVNGNDFVNKISPAWSGAIPATLFKKGDKKILVEKKMKLSDLLNHLRILDPK
jgi:thiol-disulfide isomerase/thioredoxin